MSDLRKTIIPKSDQLNFDDFIAGQTKDITITKVSLVSGDQPISINYEGDNGKPYKPCKTMRRLLVHCWGADGNQYIGRKIRLYGDPTVKWGGQEVGGIRISHLSHLEKKVVVALTETRSVRKPYTVEPLKTDPKLEEGQKKIEEAAKQGCAAMEKAWKSLDPKIAKDLEHIKVKCWAEAKEVDATLADSLEAEGGNDG